MRIKRGTAVMVGALAVLGACHRGEPAGQVVATVNGEDVTQQELNTELQTANVAATSDKQAAQRALLQRVIERKLVDGLAKQQKIDESPEYLAQRRRGDEVLLAQLYARQQLAAVPVPSGSDITKFMSDNPGIFANRQQLQLDQIRLPQPGNPSALNGIEGIHTLDGVASFLTAHGLKFTRGNTGLDSAAIPATLLTQLNKLPAGEPFVIPSPGVITINVITGRKSIANDPEQSRAVAASAWRQQKVRQALADQVTAARNAAKITYQKGFEPPAAGAKPAGAPAAP